MLRVMSATDQGSIFSRCIARRSAVRHPTPGSFGEFAHDILQKLRHIR